MDCETIQFKKLADNAIIPTRGTTNSAGFDLYALEQTYIFGGAGNAIVPTGIAVQLPEGTYGRIAMRSGLAIKKHLSVSAGVIDIDYTGGIGVVTFCTKLSFDSDNVDKYFVKIEKGEKFAQLIPEKISYAQSQVVDNFQRSYLNHAGYGSTGTGLDRPSSVMKKETETTEFGDKSGSTVSKEIESRVDKESVPFS
jgi:dUTP pyrophosphatase